MFQQWVNQSLIPDIDVVSNESWCAIIVTLLYSKGTVYLYTKVFIEII